MDVQICIADGKRYAGPLGNFGPGSVISVPEAEADALIKAKAAERVDAMPKYAEVPPIERAIAPETEDTEQAVSPEKTRKRKGRLE